MKETIELIAAHTVVDAQDNARYYISALGEGFFGDLKTCIAGIQRVFDERKMHGPHADLLFGQLVREAIAADERKPARKRGNPRPKWMRPFVRKLVLAIVRPQSKQVKEWREENIKEAMDSRKDHGVKARSKTEYRNLYREPEKLPVPGMRASKVKYRPSPSEFEHALKLHPHRFAAYGINKPLTIKSIFLDKSGRDSRRKERAKK